MWQPYGGGGKGEQALPSVYPDGRILRQPTSNLGLEKDAMIGIAIAMFIALFGWGARYFGWDDPDGKVQLALATCYILGCVSGYKAKG